jgi:hypothetical protein
VQQTYDRIKQDFLEAVSLLPVTASVKTRPAKAAAYGALARTFLSMEDYQKAGLFADSCLQMYSTLIDYNKISSLTRFNAEVIFHTVSQGGNILTPAKRKIDSLLFNSYATNDLRRTVLFKSNNNNTYSLKTGYDGSATSVFFTGIATDEMFLIRAESFARQNNAVAAMADLNTLMQNRWKTAFFVPFTAINADDALQQILTERRKELTFRGIRWPDLRRLNKDPIFAKTLTRKLSTQTYQLSPNDLRYVLLIPSQVISLNNIPQNPR